MMNQQPSKRSGQAQRPRSGQAIIFLIMVMLIGTIVVLWNFDLHHSVVLKMRLRDAGDGAALAAARWQGISLNTIGELNLVQAALLTDYLNNEIGYFEAKEALSSLSDLRRRVISIGPLVGFAAAQQVAFNNKMHENENYKQDLLEYIPDRVVEGTAGGSSPSDEYFDLLYAIVDNGLAVRTTRPIDHILMNPNFYDAIRSAHDQNWWCLFQYYPEFRTWLESYTSPSDWPPFPPSGGIRVTRLDVVTVSDSISSIAALDSNPDKEGELDETLTSTADHRDIDVGLIKDLSAIEMILGDTHYWSSLSWAVYGSSWSVSWNDLIEANNLPFRAPVRSEYDYRGPETVFRLEINYPQLSPGRSMQNMKWISAAKPFGYLESDGGDPKPPNYFGLVLPAFRDVRLIPIPPGTESSEVGPIHIRHLYLYLSGGISALDTDSDGMADTACSYCQDLIYFDDPNFRQKGIVWLADPEHAEMCELLKPGYGGSESGAQFGH